MVFRNGILIDGPNDFRLIKKKAWHWNYFWEKIERIIELDDWWCENHFLICLTHYKFFFSFSNTQSTHSHGKKGSKVSKKRSHFPNFNVNQELVDHYQKPTELTVDSAMNTVKNYFQRQSQRTSQRQDNNFDEFMSHDKNSQEPAPDNDQPNIGYDSRISSS